MTDTSECSSSSNPESGPEAEAPSDVAILLDLTEASGEVDPGIDSDPIAMGS